MEATTDNERQQREVILERVRERQWMYLGPILATPLAHWAVTLYRDAKTPRQKQFLLVGGIMGSTLMTLGVRLYLMAHAGYPGGSREGLEGRELLVTPEEKNQLENPSIREVASKAFRGFG